ncbi:protein of unknown function [Taphrina deformans PYCC 5710]|uniref:ER membrane protein complex subunit 10 n=1 Tax=Taphrina deformans (strain PYCC 5710 / ATCC 11124 / CBS 356.35 / IMI 108563 / JCM 9778 / NBRC 8474) TaxID=1097556 RepID=R4X944_TAPDE|nr:protein of unknown function [Taphrina deformans PYCC 5710]|eukprot:CCG82221.1 protein of unknown function [Taphrina deformans PYCC 5710]
MRLLSFLVPTISLFLTVFGEDSTSPAHETTLEDYKTVTIYDSISLDYPLELRERGSLTYSAKNRSGVFSESGVLSRPHDGALHVYRIGTEKIMSAKFKPLDIVNEDDFVDETLKVHIDPNGEIFHTSYDLTKAARAPGTFKIIIDHMDDHIGPEVIFNDRSTKSKSSKTAKAVVLNEEGLPIIEEEEEEVPEKTFLQKYWIYAIPLLLVLVLGGGGDQT